MRLTPSDPDVETIVSRILKKDLDLQPDFQRGEVWSDAKKRKLIDTILRDWHVPPIHVIEVKESKKQVVLDGQQRLAAIRDFWIGRIRIDGDTEPFDEDIAALDDFSYAQLPDEWRRKFNQFTIRMFRITDYSPEEPAELFYRLNQPANLTSAEQRNAFFGPARQQVKNLVALMTEVGIDKDFTGFSNSRMAYDDVVSRVCFSLEVGTLTEKITAMGLADRYRNKEGFPQHVYDRIDSAIRLLGSAKQFIAATTRFNKATLYSWLWFIAQAPQAINPPLNAHILGEFLTVFERIRLEYKGKIRQGQIFSEIGLPLSDQFVRDLMIVYDDRSSARVADISSVLYRDLIQWIMLISHLLSRDYSVSSNVPPISSLIDIVFKFKPSPDRDTAEEMLPTIIELLDWGKAL